MSEIEVIKVLVVSPIEVIKVLIPGPPGAPGTGLPPAALTARQWQSALAAQGQLNVMRDAIPADVNDPVAIQWFACGYVRPPPTVDTLWDFTQATLGYSDPQMTTLYALALTQDA